jgi:putative Mg2+ transporter-C (MgtC) family protein
LQRFVPDIPSLGWDGALVRLGVAALLGGLVGLERELDEKAAGLRTHMLVAAGSALFTLVSAYGFHEFLTRGGAVVRADPSRIAAQIVTGIGFLGAGVIFRQGLNVKGLTTAASLWLVAAVGMAAGAGFWEGAVIATIIALVSLRPLEWAKERLLPPRSRGQLLIQLAEGASGGPVLEALERRGEVRGLRQEGGRMEVDLAVAASSRVQVLGEVAALSEVVEACWSG